MRHLSVVIWCVSYKRFDGSWKWHRFIKFTSQNLTVLHNQYGCWCPWHTGSPGISVVLTLTWTTWNISMTILPIYFSFQACISIASQQWAKSLYDTMLVQISDVTGRNELIYFLSSRVRGAVISGSVSYCDDSSALAMELAQPCTKLSYLWYQTKDFLQNSVIMHLN